MRRPWQSGLSDAINKRTAELSQCAYPRSWIDYENETLVYGAWMAASSTDGHTVPPYMLAVKALKQNASLEEQQAFLDEASIMRSLDHANLVRLIGVSIAEQPWLMVADYCAFGDMHRFLQQCAEARIEVALSELYYMASQARRRRTPRCRVRRPWSLMPPAVRRSPAAWSGWARTALCTAT